MYKISEKERMNVCKHGLLLAGILSSVWFSYFLNTFSEYFIACLQLKIPTSGAGRGSSSHISS